MESKNDKARNSGVRPGVAEEGNSWGEFDSRRGVRIGHAQGVSQDRGRDNRGGYTRDQVYDGLILVEVTSCAEFLKSYDTKEKIK